MKGSAKFRKSPSPPAHGEPLVLQQQDVNLAKPQLASDFIKAMIKADKPGKGTKLKIRRSPPREAAPKNTSPLNFTLDMKRLGIMADIQGV